MITETRAPWLRDGFLEAPTARLELGGALQGIASAGKYALCRPVVQRLKPFQRIRIPPHHEDEGRRLRIRLCTSLFPVLECASGNSKPAREDGPRDPKPFSSIANRGSVDLQRRAILDGVRLQRNLSLTLPAHRVDALHQLIEQLSLGLHRDFRLDNSSDCIVRFRIRLSSAESSTASSLA
jgi:hypothetical protein